VQLTTRHPLPGVVDREKVAAARAGLPAEDVVQDAVEVFKVLSSPVRICIMHALAHDELSVGDLARALDLSLSVASHQLALLRRMKLVAARGGPRSRRSRGRT
jgi:DNA-binding transcriptional ArsR family regulator